MVRRSLVLLVAMTGCDFGPGTLDDGDAFLCGAGDARYDPFCVVDDAGVESCLCARNVHAHELDAAVLDAAPPPEPAKLLWLVLRDTGEFESRYTPGVDICGAEVVCPNGARGFAVQAELAAEPFTCIDTAPGLCDLPRDDPDSALGDPGPCTGSATFAPEDGRSQFVALGTGGVLSLRFDPSVFPRGLWGCEAHVRRLVLRGTPEGYGVSLCAAPGDPDCAPCGEVSAVPDAAVHTVRLPERCDP